ncbi:complement C1q-like protein 2 [Mercenaria mercenaria]|uniref:complement C1q-like protein 2 n=1 Tax=Mercenaria mercenaria TaxID=6596 RepID=UPI00234F3284|nr:complement C1q-like protein 2 [Mercenaria mercenaria]
MEEIVNSEEDTDNGVDDSNDEQDSGLSHRNTPKVAFSTYLSRDKLLGRGQHIKFDKVLLNDGGAYEASTGVFRATVSGVYVFTYVIAQRHKHEIRAKLVVDGKTINGAIAEGMHKWHDVQGTNTAIVHVCKGKAVWVESVSSHSNLEGNNADYRYTSFSGFLLYARR